MRDFRMSVAHAQMTKWRSRDKKGFTIPLPEMPARGSHRAIEKGIAQKPSANQSSQMPLHHWQVFQIHKLDVLPSGLKRPTMAKAKKNRLG